MKTKKTAQKGGQKRGRFKAGGGRRLAVLTLAMLAQPGVMTAAQASEIASSNPDLSIRWDNTLKYGAGWRIHGRSPVLVVDANMDDGDRNFDKGLISNRIDLLSEFDMSYQRKFGARISGAAWYDRAYNEGNDHDAPAAASQASVAFNQFTEATRKLHGRKGELLDAYVYGQFNLGTMPSTVRLGRHTLVYGESLFFGGNGIAAGQAPIDYIKLLTVPGTQFKEMMMPINQLSGQVQFSPNVSVGAYYQLQWRSNRIPASGSYLSDADFVGDGAERFFAPGSFAHVYFNRTADMQARDKGQGGLQIRYRPEGGNADYGLYATRYHAKDFTLYLNPAAVPALPSIGGYALVFPEDIKAYGASASTVLGDANVAAEISFRRDAPLVSDPVLGFNPANGALYNNSGNPNYAVGNSAHAQVSTIYVLKGSPLWQGGDLLAEIAWNRRLSVTKNASAIDPKTTRDALAFRLLFSPQYYQVLPGIDLTVPVGLGYLVNGRSSVDLKFGAGAEHGGDFSIGAKFDYRQLFKVGFNFVHFFGPEGTFLVPNQPPALTALQYKQSLKDRDFLTFSIQATF